MGQNRSSSAPKVFGVLVVLVVVLAVIFFGGSGHGETFRHVFTFLVVVGVIIFLLVAFAIFYLGRHLYYAVKGEEYVPLVKPRQRAYQHQDVDGHADEKEVAEILRRYANLDTVGTYARAGRAALESSRRRCDGFFAVLETKFQKGSMSWDKFSVAAKGAHQAIVRNCAVIANTVQLFDRDEYRRLARLYRQSASQGAATTTDLENQKWWLMQQNLRTMDAIIVANDQLMLEIDKLTVELNKLKSVDGSEAGDRLIEEIRTLIDETKYYQHAMNELDRK